MTHKGYPDSTGVDYVYDLMGKIQLITDSTGVYGFAYDNMGRLIGISTDYAFDSAGAYTNSYTYDAASNRTGFTAPDGSTNIYGYDTLNRLSSLSNSLTGAFGFSYDALGRRTQLTRPNGGWPTLSRPVWFLLELPRRGWPILVFFARVGILNCEYRGILTCFVSGKL